MTEQSCADIRSSL